MFLNQNYTFKKKEKLCCKYGEQSTLHQQHIGFAVEVPETLPNKQNLFSSKSPSHNLHMQSANSVHTFQWPSDSFVSMKGKKSCVPQLLHIQPFPQKPHLICLPNTNQQRSRRFYRHVQKNLKSKSSKYEGVSWWSLMVCIFFFYFNQSGCRLFQYVKK